MRIRKGIKRRHSSRLLKPVYITQAEYTIEPTNKPYTALYARRKDNADMTHFALSLADRITQGSRKAGGIKHAFKSVLKAVYNQPYMIIPPKPSRAYMGFCDALASIKKAPASRQEMPPKLALSPIECQNLPYYLVDYRVKGSVKNSRGVCPRRKI